MFLYCIWCGDRYENTRMLLTHSKKYTESEFQELCDNIREKLIDSTTTDLEIMDTVDGKKSIWEYGMDFPLLRDLRNVLIMEYGFQGLEEFPSYHAKGVDPYDYESN